MEKEFGVMEDLDTVKTKTVRFCPKCKKQSYHICLNRVGLLLSGECVLCGYKINKGK